MSEPDDWSSKVAEFRSLIAQDESLRGADELVDEALLVRFLRARKWDLKKAFPFLKDHLKWRMSEDLDSLTPDHPAIAIQLPTGKNYHFGYDRQGRPIQVMKVNKDTDASTLDQKMQFLTFHLERLSKYLDANKDTLFQDDKGGGKWIWLIDLQGFSWSWLKPDRVRLGGRTVNLLQDHYPDRLHRLYLYNSPKVFTMFYNLIKHFVDPVTVAKIVFLPSNRDQCREQLSKDIDLDQIETYFSGDSDHEYSVENVVEFMSKEYVEKLRQKNAEILHPQPSAPPADDATSSSSSSSNSNSNNKEKVAAEHVETDL